MLPRAADGQGATCVKAFYLPDQFSVMSIARNVADGRATYVEPFTATGSSIYPSAYYWLMGRVSDLGGTTVLGAWNALGLVSSLLLLGVCVLWARWAAPGSAAWLLAPLPVLAGSLQWWRGGDWSADLGGPVIWPAAANLYSPGAETPALACALLAVLAMAAAMNASGRRRLGLAAAAGLAAGGTLHLHAYVATFTALAMVLMLVAEAVVASGGRSRLFRTAAASTAALLVALVVLPGSGFGGRLALIVAVLLGALAIDAGWRRRMGPIVLAWGAAALLAAAPLLLRIVGQILDPDSFFHLREASVTAVSLEPPPGLLLVLCLPVALLTGAALLHLGRAGRADPRRRAWFAALTGVAAATVLLTYNRRLGIEGLESYRFVPYGLVLAAALAAPWLWTAIADGARRERATGAVVGTALAAGLPTIVAFATAQWQAVRCFLPQERAAYDQVAQAVGPRELVLLDRCFVPYEVKVLSGMRVVNVNPGLAVPERFPQVRAALKAVAIAQGPAAAQNAPRDVFARSGATRFVTRTGCDGLTRPLIRARFGSPIQRVEMTSPGRFGLPDPTHFEIYRIPATTTH
jgi:hypothetical protein